MQTVNFALSHVAGDAQLEDLGNAINGISGVSAVNPDQNGLSVRVEYDPAFVNTVMLRGSIEGAGYPISSQEESAS